MPWSCCPSTEYTLCVCCTNTWISNPLWRITTSPHNWQTAATRPPVNLGVQESLSRPLISQLDVLVGLIRTIFGSTKGYCLAQRRPVEMGKSLPATPHKISLRMINGVCKCVCVCAHWQGRKKGQWGCVARHNTRWRMRGLKLYVNLCDGSVWPSHPICMSLSANESQQPALVRLVL